MLSSFFHRILFISFGALIFYNCTSDNSTNPPDQNYPDYYPNGIGLSYTYLITETDTLGNIIQNGNRYIQYTGSFNLNGQDYTTQVDSLEFDSLSSYSTYIFRKSETGVFYLVDTSQISFLIPDTLKEYVTLRDEMQLLFSPLTNGSSWSLYRITAEVQPGISVKILDIIASYINKEQLDLNLTGGVITVNSQKIKYDLEIYSEINSPPQRFTAYMWFAEDIGLVKYEGNQFIIDIGGGGISFEPSPNILTQELIEYEIK